MLLTILLAALQDYAPGPDHQEQAGVPKGRVEELAWKESRVYPGTERQVWIYTPANLDPAREYPVIVFQDGGGAVNPKGTFRVPIVLDNLIHKGEIPPMLALFVNPGTVPPAVPGGKARSTRSFEYDTPDGVYARFLLEELFPELEKRAKVSPRPDDRAIAGVSSGGICAFTAAWFRPDAFRRVITGIGSFTNIRGGVWYPAAIRKTEPKPIRVFLQEGEKDLDNVHGNWPIANRDLAAALAFAGYDHKVVWGTDGHSGRHLGAILPDALRWLWRKDGAAPRPVAEVKNDMALSGLLVPGKGWVLVVPDGTFVDAPCADAEGNFYYSELGGGTGLHRIAPDGTRSVWNAKAVGISGMKFGPDGRLYACHTREKRVIAVDAKGDVEVLLTDVACNDLVVGKDGRVYVTETKTKRVWVVEGPGKARPVDVPLAAPNGLALSPDGDTLAVSDSAGTSAWAFRIEKDGTPASGLPVFPYRDFGPSVEGKGDGMACDTRGRWYVGTLTGIQVYDPNGRPIGLIPAPGPVTSTALAGSWLYSLSKGTIHRRPVDATALTPVSGR